MVNQRLDHWPKLGALQLGSQRQTQCLGWQWKNHNLDSHFSTKNDQISRFGPRNSLWASDLGPGWARIARAQSTISGPNQRFGTLALLMGASKRSTGPYIGRRSYTGGEPIGARYYGPVLISLAPIKARKSGARMKEKYVHGWSLFFFSRRATSYLAGLVSLSIEAPYELLGQHSMRP